MHEKHISFVTHGMYWRVNICLRQYKWSDCMEIIAYTTHFVAFSISLLHSLYGWALVHFFILWKCIAPRSILSVVCFFLVLLLLLLPSIHPIRLREVHSSLAACVAFNHTTHEFTNNKKMHPKTSEREQQNLVEDRLWRCKHTEKPNKKLKFVLQTYNNETLNIL